MIELITETWPVIIGVITLIIVLSKMHLNIEILKDKVTVLFNLLNGLK